MIRTQILILKEYGFTSYMAFRKAIVFNRLFSGVFCKNVVSKRILLANRDKF